MMCCLFVASAPAMLVHACSFDNLYVAVVLIRCSSAGGTLCSGNSQLLTLRQPYSSVSRQVEGKVAPKRSTACSLSPTSRHIRPGISRFRDTWVRTRSCGRGLRPQGNSGDGSGKTPACDESARGSECRSALHSPSDIPVDHSACLFQPGPHKGDKRLCSRF